MQYRVLAVALVGAAALSGCTEGVLDPRGPIASAERQILLNSLGIMLAIVIPTILATLGVAYWFRASNTRARYLPPSGYMAIWPPPEVLDNVQNVAGLTPTQAAAQGVAGVTATNGQVGNLQLTASQETDLVNFLKILSDGYTAPNPAFGAD